MLEPLLWIIGCYAACIALVHMIHLWKKPDASQRETWVIITHNHQHKVEWMLRALLLASWFKGKAINLYVVDRGSSDHTVQIIQRLAEHNPFPWTIVSTEEELEQVMQGWSIAQVNILDLERTDAGQAAPMYR